MKKRAESPIIGLENKHQALLSRLAFLKRLASSFGVATALIAFSLFGGMIGYRHFEGMEWIDAFVNASMILSGMGQLANLQTWNGKLFAGLYALYSGLALVLATGILLRRSSIDCCTASIWMSARSRRALV